MTSGVGAIALYWLVRWLIESAEQPQPAPTHEVIKPPIIAPPPRRPSPPPFSPPPYSPPVVPWTEPRELLAWRAWRLGFFLRRAGGDGGPRLLSLSAPCIWNGPVVRAGAPVLDTQYPSGIYALKPEVADRIQWQNEYCWVTGTIALSGRVIEHEIGYRAERAVVRELRLGVGAHLALRSLTQLRATSDALEDRYQVAVHIGQAEREIADRMLESGHNPQAPKLPFVWDQQPWRLI
ncbi:MAG: hypothetical protein DMD54_17980 [Gemmatimonadetes bacterium]|nr:MAG: hypothetical protein DMD54_17980 [Gemmatimonadota bacterium]